MARHRRVDEARLQQMLAEDTIDLLGDITFTEICEPATDADKTMGHAAIGQPSSQQNTGVHN